MKTYYAILEICKIYRQDPFASFFWRKACASRKEAAAFINRVGSGKSGLYWVYRTHIKVK